MTESEQAKHIWALRFSLRSLLILMALVAAFLGGHLLPSSADRKLEQRIAELEAAAEASAELLAAVNRQSQNELEEALTRIDQLERQTTPIPKTRTFFLEPVPVRPQ